MKKVLIVLAMVFGLVSVSWAGVFAAGEVLTDVSFAWTANTENDLLGYRVYRSEVSGTYNETNLVGTVDAPASQFVDVAVPDGTYFWAAAPVDTAGNESNLSNEVTATLDTVPPAPITDFHIVPAVILLILEQFMENDKLVELNNQILDKNEELLQNLYQATKKLTEAEGRVKELEKEVLDLKEIYGNR